MTNSSLKDLYMTSGEICELLHVHPNTVHRWRKAGKLTGKKVGRGYLYPTAEVMAILDLETDLDPAAEIASMSVNAE